MWYHDAFALNTIVPCLIIQHHYSKAALAMALWICNKKLKITI